MNVTRQVVVLVAAAAFMSAPARAQTHDEKTLRLWLDSCSAVGGYRVEWVQELHTSPSAATGNIVLSRKARYRWPDALYVDESAQGVTGTANSPRELAAIGLALSRREVIGPDGVQRESIPLSEPTELPGRRALSDWISLRRAMHDAPFLLGRKLADAPAEPVTLNRLDNDRLAVSLTAQQIEFVLRGDSADTFAVETIRIRQPDGRPVAEVTYSDFRRVGGHGGLVGFRRSHAGVRPDGTAAPPTSYTLVFASVDHSLSDADFAIGASPDHRQAMTSALGAPPPAVAAAIEKPPPPKTPWWWYSPIVLLALLAWRSVRQAKHAAR